MEFIEKKDVPYFLDCEPLVLGMGYKLVELNAFKRQTGWQIKAVIYSKHGLSIDDCAKVHKVLLSRMEVILNSQDVYMEVGSPGINRVIKKTAELYAFIGEKIAVWVAEISDWKTGELLSVSHTGIEINENGTSVKLLYPSIKKVKLMS